MENKTDTQELISALADGQLRGGEFARVLQLAQHDPAALEAWRTYHVIGDVLRSQDLALHARPNGFVTALQAKLAQEPRIVAPIQATEAATTGLQNSNDMAATPRVAANDSVRWKVAAGFASVAAVAAIGWNVAGTGALTGPQLAAAPAPSAVAVTATTAGPMIRDARLDKLLAAHRQLGGAAALQATGGFLRNATFEAPAR